MHAELAYLFRHALLRDAAYQLQLPGDRARLALARGWPRSTRTAPQIRYRRGRDGK